MKGRIAQKGNVSGIGYDVRITEEDGKSYHYHFFKLEDGDSIMFSDNPFNIKGETEISWDELPFKLKETHCKKIYPNDNLNDYEKRCLLYGKQQTDEAIAAEREKEEKRNSFYSEKAYRFPIYSSLAMKVYDEIGWYKNVEVVYEKGRFCQFIVDDKYVVKARSFNIISIERKDEYDAKRKEWGHKVKSIAASAGTSFDIATVVANIQEVDEAIQILKKIKEILDNNELIPLANAYPYWNNDLKKSWNLKSYVERFETTVKSLLEVQLSTKVYQQLDFSNKFYNALAVILREKE